MYELARVLELLDAGEEAPRCETCGAVLKPGVVFFDELLPAAAIDRAFNFARRARLLLVVGTSLEVWPVAGLPDETLAAGGRIAVVNHDPTAIDERAELVIRGPAGETLETVAGALA